MLTSIKFLRVPVATQFKSLSTQVNVDWQNAKPYEQIPGPKALEIARGMFPGGRFYKLELDELLMTMRKDFGNIVKLPGILGQRPIVMTFAPEEIEMVFRNEGKFPWRRPFDSFHYFRTQHKPELYPAGAGLVTTQGQEWYDFRSKVQQVLMQPRIAKTYIPGLDVVASDFIDKVRSIRDAKNEMPDDFYETLNEWALESVGLIALDTRLGIMKNPEAAKLNGLIKQFFQMTFKYDIQPSVWRYFQTPGFKKALNVYEASSREVRQYIVEAVERYEKNPSPDINESGVLEKLIKIDKSIGIAMAEDMLLAGVDTTSTAVTSVLYSLAKNPDKQEKLREEILTILPEKSSKLTPTSFNSVPYLRAVIKEALRVLPVANGNLRALDHDTVLQGYRVPKDTDILLPGSLLAFDEDQFKRSREFIPERWLKNNEDPECPHAKDAHPFTYLPFGFGSRMCIGRRFAEIEIEVLTTRIVREFKLEWHHADLKYKSLVINLPNSPLKLQFNEI